MDNVYDIKIHKNLNFILPSEQRLVVGDRTAEMGKVAVIIHLHYIQSIEFYLKYIENITPSIRVLITTSNDKVEDLLYKFNFDKRKNCSIIKKNNRGRDISSFLVACRKEILGYEYVCFLHDKMEKFLKDKRSIEKWVQSLWENMIGSKEYIYNVLYTFYNNPQIGLLVPPPPIGDHFYIAYKNSWFANYKITKELVDKLGLKCDLDENKSPITYGTVFWTRVSALSKLFNIEWKYEDFDEEPLGTDGTVSHAIERSLAYIAQDAGYDTGWVMTDKYAGQNFDYMISALGRVFHMVEEEWGISSVSEVDTYVKREKELLEFVNRYDSFYIYGAGEYGKKCLIMLKRHGKLPKGFMVSNLKDNRKYIENVPVYVWTEVDDIASVGIIVAVHEKYRGEILGSLSEQGIEFSNIYQFEKE